MGDSVPADMPMEGDVITEQPASEVPSAPVEGSSIEGSPAELPPEAKDEDTPEVGESSPL